MIQYLFQTSYVVKKRIYLLIMQNSLKKILNSVVLSVVVLSTVGPVLAKQASAETAAGCPTLMPGDNVKVVSPTSRPAIYAINKNGDIVYYERGALYKEWNKNYQFIGITQSCFDSLHTPSSNPFGVGYPAGTVVRRPNSDQLYLVLAGQQLALITNDAATAMFGSNLNVKQEVDVNWTNYQMSSTTISSGKVQPGMVFMNAGKTWYLNESMQLQEVTAAGMTANNVGGNGRTVPTVTDAAVSGFTVGSQVTSEVMWLTDVTQGTGGASTNGGSTGASTVTVSLASANPVATTLVSDTTNGAQTMAPVLKLRFTASGSDAVVTGLNVARQGVSSDSDVSNMHLYDGSTRVASNPSISNGMVKFTNSSGLFTVPKDGSKELTLLLDVKGNVSSGKTFVFSLKAPQDVTVKNGSLNSAGSFPFMGNEFRVASVTDLGKFTLQALSPTSNSTVDAGSTNFEVARFQAQSSSQDIELRKLAFTFVGSINAEDVGNCNLSVGGIAVVDPSTSTSTKSLSSDKTVTFDMSSNPALFTSGQTKIISLKCDIIKGTNRDFRVTVQNNYDVVAYDKAYNTLLMPNGTDTFSIIQPNTNGILGTGTSVKYTVNTGNLTQSVATTTLSSTIADGATNVTVGTFLWKANGEDIKVNNLSVSSTAASTTLALKNVKLLVNGSQVGTTIASTTANGTAYSGWGSFGSSFIIKAGTTSELKVVADLTDSSVISGHTLTVGLAAGSSNAQGTTSLQSISTISQNANSLSVSSGTVTVTKNTSFGDRTSSNPTGSVNAQQAKVSSFTIAAGGGEDVTLNSFTLKDNAASPDCVGVYMQNLTLRSATGTLLATPYANPSTSCSSANSFVFTFSPAVNVKNGQQFVVDVFADLKAPYTTNAALLELDSVDASGVTTSGSAGVSSLNLDGQKVYIGLSGALTVAVDSSSPTDNHYLMGSTDQTLAIFKFSATNNEPVVITDLVLSNNVSATSATGTLTNIRLVDANNPSTVYGSAANFVDTNSTGTLAHASLKNLTNLVVPAGLSKTVAVVADIVGYDPGGFTTTGQTNNIGILKYSTGSQLAVVAKGFQSGSLITPTVTTSTNGSYVVGLGANNPLAAAATSTLYRTRLSVAWASDTPTAPSRSAEETVAKFVITNSANVGNYDAVIKAINFDITSTVSNTAARSLKVYADSLSSAGNNTGLLATTSYAGTGQTFVDTNFADGDFADITIGAGKSKTFLVTVDLTNASDTVTRSFNIRVGNGDILWSDGITNSTKMSELPLLYRSFTYSN